VSESRVAPEPGEPLVSLIMTVWRPRPDWLLEAVDAALGQQDCRVELIVVDDGSPRPVAEILQARPDQRLRVIRTEHGGISRARNAGMMDARGTWFRFLDGDDALPPDSTAHLLGLTQGRPDIVAYGASVFCDSNLRPRYRLQSRMQGKVELECLLDRFNVRLQALLFSRWLIENHVGLWDPSLGNCQDWDFTLRALEHGRARGDSQTVVYYRQHPDSASADPEAAWRGSLAVVDRYRERHPEIRGSRIERRIEAMLAVMNAARETGGRPWRSRKFWRASLTDPWSLAAGLRRPLRGRVVRFRRIAQHSRPADLVRRLGARLAGADYVPCPGRASFGSLRRLAPLDRRWGYGRGRPVDRHYIELFLAAHCADIQGKVLEIGDDRYTRRFGRDRVVQSDVLHVDGGNPYATLVGDLSSPEDFCPNMFDCILVTQVLQFVREPAAALRTLVRMLRPGGVVLATVPGISPIDRKGMEAWGDYWRFTSRSAHLLFEQAFDTGTVEVKSFGNVLSSTAFLYGLAAEELDGSELTFHDPDYELVIGIRATKGGR
jgi:glycosyltransferase involved in cell wall biosynthesis/SAM-dependent methyltransferase